MIYKTNISRKKDFKTIQQIIDYNEYYSRETKIVFDKNFFFYTIQIKMKDEKVNPRDLTGINTSVMKKLHEAGFILQEYYIEMLHNSGIVSSFSIPDSLKHKNVIYRTRLVLVRESEIDKYFMRGFFY